MFSWLPDPISFAFWPALTGPSLCKNFYFYFFSVAGVKSSSGCTVLLTAPVDGMCSPTFQCRPVIYYQDSRFIMNFGRTPLLGSSAHPRPTHYPAVSALQLEALDAIEAIAKATQLEIQTKAGDMHFINNFAVLHRRESFTDGASATQKRHLVRSRLRNEAMAWALPDDLKNEWSKAFGSRGDRVWHVEPMPDVFMPLRLWPN
jgi:TfdA family taurine catabolism dioxygenase TauD